MKGSMRMPWFSSGSLMNIVRLVYVNVVTACHTKADNQRVISVAENSLVCNQHFLASSPPTHFVCSHRFKPTRGFLDESVLINSIIGPWYRPEIFVAISVVRGHLFPRSILRLYYYLFSVAKATARSVNTFYPESHCRCLAHPAPIFGTENRGRCPFP